MLTDAGECWRKQVIGQERPETGSEMHNTALAAALQQGTRWFSKEELEALKVCMLTYADVCMLTYADVC
jgi:hypothetical protein